MDVAMNWPSFSRDKPLTLAAARNAALVNQLATPGLGTLMLGRFALGCSQLALALAGFLLVIIWFGSVLYQYYGQISGDVTVRPVGWIGISGGVLFIAAWIWSLFTSLKFLQEARRLNTPPVYLGEKV
jgi:hypothetical protein